MRFISAQFLFCLEKNWRSKLQVLQCAMPCQAPCEEGVMEVMTCECVTHWTWSNSWQVAAALLTILWPHTYTIIATSSRGLNSHSLAKVLLPKSQWPSRMIWAFPFVYQEFWYLKTFKSGQGSMIFRDFAAKKGFIPGSDGFWIGETISSSGANQIGDGARRKGKRTGCSLHFLVPPPFLFSQSIPFITSLTV